MTLFIYLLFNRKQSTTQSEEREQETETDNMYYYHSVQIHFISVTISSASNRPIHILGFSLNNKNNVMSFNTAILANNSDDTVRR